MKSELENKEWKEFDLKDVFPEIQRGRRLRKADHIEGHQPYVSSKGINNGLDGYVGNKEKVRIFKNCLTLANSGSVGSCFYQSFAFVASDHVTKLDNKKLDKYTNLFISNIASRIGPKYSFNREINDKRIRREKILLPVNHKGEPDYEFMEQYMRHKEKVKVTEYQDFIQTRLKQLKNTPKTVSINEKKWIDFKIVDIFKPTRGNQNKMASLLEGKIPLVSAKNGNNGLKSFVTLNEKKTYPKESLTLNNDGDGGAGFSYYQPFDYLLDSHVTSLVPQKTMSKHSMLFISRCITKQRNRFGHGYAINNNRLKAFKIMLPVNKNNKPDYDYMENYMKNLEYKKLSEYLEFKKR